MRGKVIEEINIGDKAEFSKTITEADIYMFAGVTGDMNPVHINREFAKGTIFSQRIAHGILSVGLISNVLGTQLPGPGAVYVRQECNFLKPVYIGDTITAVVEVIRKEEQKNRVWLRTYCTNQKGQIVVEGEALMMPRKEVKENSVLQFQEHNV
ncbi:MAG: MaoC family dehydratase [Syntrophomonadaceae bacterium]|nr:MaoC family dehydratase [Syntrophomonadaceae bacterium]